MADTLPPYDPEWLAFEQQMGGRFVLSGDIASIRQQFDGLFTGIKPMLPEVPGVETQDLKTDDGVPVRVYKPQRNDSTPIEETLPVGLYIHSGGWTCGSIQHEDYICRLISSRTPCVLVSVEYRLAPEHPFPAALDDCCDAAAFVVQKASQLGADNDRSFTIGGSAGGNLALAVALQNVDTKDAVKAVFAMCPGALFHGAWDKLPEQQRRWLRLERYDDAAMLSVEAVRSCHTAYTHEPANELVSVALHPKLGQLPHLWVSTSDKDPCNDEAMVLVERAREMGGKVELREDDGYPHFFFSVPSLQRTEEFFGGLTAAIREQMDVS